MSIRTNIEGVMEDIENGNTALGDEVRAKSIAAILAGTGTSEWSDYMGLFSTSPTELARLLPTDGTDTEEDMRQARTYLVGNGTCGADTTGTRLIEGVWDILDQEIP